MKRLMFLIFLLEAIAFAPLFSQETVTEKVTIDWWALPLFAVDSGGDAVLDLTDKDIDLRVNNRTISGFTIYKREFSVDTITTGADKKKPQSQFAKNKIVFLMFDLAFTSGANYKQAKEIAKNLVRETKESTLFTIIAIDPLRGPKYIGGPLTNKEQVSKLIDNKVRWDRQTKDLEGVFKMLESSRSMGKSSKKGGNPKPKHTSKELTSLLSVYGSGWRHANKRFYQSFQTLYHALNSIKDNKFIYLFSEGISMFARLTAHQGELEYLNSMKKTAGYLGQSGAVLFIVNPAGAKRKGNSLFSGERSLRYLAEASGGKYIEGETKTIDRQIASMHRAYYEIAFPDQDSFAGKIHHLTISAKRKGVNIHSLRSLEKSKPYSEMNDIEKELLALNLLEANPLFQSPLKTRKMKIKDRTEDNNLTRYKIDLPRDFQQKKIDVFKISFAENTGDAQVKKESVITSKGSLKIETRQKGNDTSRIVLINERINTALVQVLSGEEIKKKEILTALAVEFEKKVDRMTAQEIEELRRIRTGAAGYCKRLGEAAFHYICKETVSEELEIPRPQDDSTDVTAKVTPVFVPEQSSRRPRIDMRKITNKFVNDYQLISNKGVVKEQRKLLKGTTKKISGKDELLRLDSFITRKISLSPISLLGPYSQERFHYLFIKFSALKGVKCAVVECFPKDTAVIKSVYGKIWVDLSDFSVMRMSINPVSIGGYGELLKRARNYARHLKTRLTLTCDIDFLKKREGIRFPTKVLIREVYNGGSNLKYYSGKRNWERSKTTYTFDDYQFFDAAATSSVGNRD